MSQNDWTKNSKLNQIDPAKLQMLISMAEKSKGMKQNELLPFFIAAATQSKSKGMSFTSEETDAIIEVLKTGKSPEEIAKIERMMSMMKSMK